MEEKEYDVIDQLFMEADVARIHSQLREDGYPFLKILTFSDMLRSYAKQYNKKWRENELEKS